MLPSLSFPSSSGAAVRCTGALVAAIALFCGTLSAFAATSSDTCTVQASPARPSPFFDALATQDGPGTGNEPAGTPGWTGADSSYSVLLPNGDTAFFFSDSFIGQSPQVPGDGTVTTHPSGLRTRATNLFAAHNSIVVYHPATGRLTTIAGPVNKSGHSTSYFAPANPNHFYWMGDAVLIRGGKQIKPAVWVFVLEFDAGWNFYGSAIAQLSVPSLAVEKIMPLQSIPAGNTINWGSALWLDQASDTLYIYGMNGHKPYVARTRPSLGLAAAADTSNWLVADASHNWVHGLDHAAPILGATSDPRNARALISQEYSVKKIRSNAGTTYLLVTQDVSPPFGAEKNIELFSACSPQGPFSAPQVVYATPETGAKTVPGMSPGQSLKGVIITYNPHAHPQFIRSGKLLVSYDLNSSSSDDSIYADTYRPRFIWVPIAGLQPSF